MISVSIIVPVYNVEPYIKECLQSVMAQTYQGPMECILVDDCGSDRSMEIAENLVSSYHGPIVFRILHHDHNRGLSAARNTGIDAAKGDYILFVDSDDYLLQNSIERLVAKTQIFSGVDMVVGGISTKGRASCYDISNFRTKLPEYSDNKKWLRKIILKGTLFPVMAWNKLINRNFLIQNQLYFKGGIIHEDVFWNFQLQRCINTIAFLNEPTYFYRINPDGIVEQSKLNKKSVDSYKYILNEIYNTIDTTRSNIYEMEYFLRYLYVYATNSFDKELGDLQFKIDDHRQYFKFKDMEKHQNLITKILIKITMKLIAYKLLWLK